MEKQKTAVTKIIEYIENVKDATDYKVTPEKWGTLIALLYLAKNELATERKQIEDAYNDSWGRTKESWEESSSEYFVSKFEIKNNY